MQTISSGNFFEDESIYVFFGNKDLDSQSEIFNQKKLIFGKQTHDASIQYVEPVVKPYGSFTFLDSSDGLTTKTKNLSLAIYTADCIPCFIKAKDSLFSLHLGWRGIQKGLFDKALKSTEGPFRVFIGPHIRSESFEVGNEVVGALQKTTVHSQNTWSHLNSKTGKTHISLEKILMQKSLDFKAKVHTLNIDTFTSKLHHSFRASHGGTARNISFAFLKK